LIEIDRGELCFQPGQYCFINVPNLSLLQWHPYSIASGPSEDKLVFIIRDMGPGTWSHRLHQLAARASGVNSSDSNEYLDDYSSSVQTDLISTAFELKVDGPYGSIGLNLQDYKESLLISCGIGITPVMSLLRNLRQQLHSAQRANASKFHTTASTFGRCRLVHLVWIVQRPEHLAWYGQELVELINHCRSSSNSLVTVDVQLFVTRPDNRELSTGTYVLPRPKATYMAYSAPTFTSAADSFAYDDDQQQLQPEQQPEQLPNHNTTTTKQPQTTTTTTTTNDTTTTAATNNTNNNTNNILPPAISHLRHFKIPTGAGSVPSQFWRPRRSMANSYASNEDSTDSEDEEDEEPDVLNYNEDVFISSSNVSANTVEYRVDTIVTEDDDDDDDDGDDDDNACFDTKDLPTLEYAIGRPDIDQVFRTIANGYRSFSADPNSRFKRSVVGVLVCGSRPIELLTKKCCHEHSDSVVEFIFHQQSFIL
jgi:hypothetical protein